MPFVGRLILALALVALGLGVAYVGLSGIGTVVGAVGSTVGGFVDNVTATPSPTPSFAEVSDAPSVAAPEEPYTRAGTTDLAVTVGSDVVAEKGNKLRIYLALKDQGPAPIQDVPIAGPVTIVPVTLTKGMNDFTVTVVGPGGESDPSPVVRFIQDQAPPKITVSSPKNGAIVNGTAVHLKGKTQGRTTLIARNATNGASITGDALADGTFDLTLAIANGVNRIKIEGTDPAGNVTNMDYVIKRGTGKLTVVLVSSTYQIRRGNLPYGLRLTASASDPDGRPLPGAAVTFTLSMPGIPTVTSDGTTSANGIATFRTTIPKGADLGQGTASVLISADGLGSTQDFTVITIRR